MIDALVCLAIDKLMLKEERWFPLAITRYVISLKKCIWLSPVHFFLFLLTDLRTEEGKITIKAEE